MAIKFIRKINKSIDTITTKEVEGAEVYIVSWDARYGKFSGDVKRVAKVFLKLEDAREFAKSLKLAKKLLQYEEFIDIKIEKQK